MSAQSEVESIISNAIETANEQVNGSNEAAQAAINASQGYSFIGSSDIVFPITAIEPNFGLAPDSLLTYEAQLAELVALLSGQLASFFTQYYPLASDAYDAGTNWVLNEITQGGTGLSPYIEDQIWQRGRDRILSDGKRAENQIFTEFASRGFLLPAGPMAARISEVRFEGLLKISGLSSDVAIKEAELTLTNLKFAVELAIKTRIQALDAAVNYIRALMTAPDAAARVALLNSEARARLVSATSELYRARLTRDEIAMRVPFKNKDTGLEIGRINSDGFYKGVDSKTRAAVGAADAYGRTAAAALSSLNSLASTSTQAQTPI